ncbi:MAG: hypothetical protein ACI9FU_000886 [Granulosicoccus sp.]|jgi:hypothetical protein
MKRVFGLMIICLLGLALSTSAQVEVIGFPKSAKQSEADSIVENALEAGEPGYDTTVYRKRKHRLFNPLLNLDNHNTLFFGSSTSIWGLKLGATIAGRYRIGFGAYILPKRLAISTLLDANGMDSVYRKFDMMYFTTFMEFVPISNFRWELSIPLSLGYGFANIGHRHVGETEYKIVQGKQGFLLHTGVSAHYRIFSWLGVGMGLGYRQVLTPDTLVNQAVSGVFASFKLKIFLGDLYFLIFKPDIIKGEKMAWKDQRRRKKELGLAAKEARRIRHEEARRK